MIFLSFRKRSFPLRNTLEKEMFLEGFVEIVFEFLFEFVIEFVFEFGGDLIADWLYKHKK